MIPELSYPHIKKGIGFLFLAFCTTFLLSDCSKEDLPALGRLDENTLNNRKGVEGLLIGAYALLDGISNDDVGGVGFFSTAASNWIYGSICGGEAYTGSEQADGGDIRSIERFQTTASFESILGKWSVVYAGAQRANSVLRVMERAVDIPDEEKARIRAETLFLRAHYHFEAVKMWHKAPFLDESVTYDNDNYRLANDTLIWGAIEDDLRYAVNNLPLVFPSTIGRANKYAAEAMLAKIYLFQAKYAEAKPLLQDLIDNGTTSGGDKYALVNFADNFNPATKNSAESVFAVQSSVDNLPSDGFNTNGNAGDVLNFPFGGGPGGCCGFFQPSQYLVNHFKTDPVTGLPDLDNFNINPVKNDQGIPADDPYVPYAGTLDSRLDWTVGRRGIPYLDWGDHPGMPWIRDQSFSGPYSPIKNVYYQSQEGTLTESSSWISGFTANNVNLIRFSDILLWAAEVEIEIGSLDQAREYVNRVRERAADDTGWVKRSDGTPAANYMIGLYTESWTDQEYARKAVRYERALELAMEGHRFFDLVRWGIADQEINDYLQTESTFRTHLAGATFVKGKHEYFPIPQTEIDLSAGLDGNPRLKQNPGY